ncbi:hypothetical protein BDV96DRAFT_598798 [Lophiotrema nucula]|uniref:Uncharacterized protein n=1 Tax=Lophiotrema nucula TaxID=690887 RepID=A0A6A5ZAA0_9PLEO|nr:hypothetical protein BDV96DRAFT_598798 [Lophiotrema nucula]
MEQQPFQGQQEVDTRLPFRTGWPILPVLPVETSSLNARVWSTELDPTDVQQFSNILSHNDVYMRHIFFAHRHNKGVPVSERKPTLVVYSDIQKEGQNIENWRQAVRDIRNMLKEQGINNITVEITDYRASDMDKIETDLIMPNEKEVLDAWTELAPRIVQRLSSHNYLSIELLHRNWIGAQEGAKATVVICAADANDSRWWDETIPAVRALLPSFLGIELLYLRTICAMDESGSLDRNKKEDDRLDKIRHKLDMMRYLHPESIHMGASCGRKWKGEEVSLVGQEHLLAQESGTLGGLIKFEDVAQQFGLSNHHVFFEGKDYDGKEKEKISEPLRPGSALISAGIPILSPSNADLSRKHLAVQQEIADIEDQHSLLRNKHIPDANKWLSHTAQGISALNDIVCRLDPDVGTIYASSGSRSIRNKEMENLFRGTWESDWCLIQINADKTIEKTTPRLWVNEEPTQATVYHSISPFQIYDVMKYGRTSGKTIGTVSAAMTILRKETDDLPPLPKNTEKFPSVSLFGKPGEPVPRTGNNTQGGEIPTRICHAVRSRQQGRHFMASGDSGCFVLLDPPDETPRKVSPIVGLGFGHNGATGTAYMMPFDLVVNDIQDVTGQTVVLPKYDGEATPAPPRTSATRMDGSSKGIYSCYFLYFSYS